MQPEEKKNCSWFVVNEFRAKVVAALTPRTMNPFLDWQGTHKIKIQAPAVQNIIASSWEAVEGGDFDLQGGGSVLTGRQCTPSDEGVGAEYGHFNEKFAWVGLRPKSNPCGELEGLAGNWRDNKRPTTTPVALVVSASLSPGNAPASLRPAALSGRRRNADAVPPGARPPAVLGAPVPRGGPARRLPCRGGRRLGGLGPAGPLPRPGNGSESGLCVTQRVLTALIECPHTWQSVFLRGVSEIYGAPKS